MKSRKEYHRQVRKSMEKVAQDKVEHAKLFCFNLFDALPVQEVTDKTDTAGSSTTISAKPATKKRKLKARDVAVSKAQKRISAVDNTSREGCK